MQADQIIGPYKVVFPIKKGLYAETYRVTNEMGEKYFLKLINLAKLSDLQVEGSIENVIERGIIKNIAHPNITKMVDSGETIIDGQRYVYIICDYIVGETVQQKVSREKHCSVYDIKQIITGVLNGLKYLHRQEEPIIHNELTPDNIMLDLSGTSMVAKIIDFGHAQKLNSKNHKCYIDGLNPFFMAPEMFKGLYSTRTDLYAVGTMMYYLLYGIYPWYVDISNIKMDLREKVLLAERQNPLKIPNINIFELDETMLKVIAKSLNQDVDKRFQSADEFLLALNGEVEIEDANFEKVDVEGATVPKEKTVVNKKKGNGFEDVAGMEDLKQRLRTEVIDIINNPDKYRKLRVKIPNGILLYGPPGCGKTYIAEKFAEEIGCNYMYVHCSDVASPYIHGGQEKIAALFEKARENAPTVLFLDELDAMIADRSRHNNVSEYGEVNEFLTQLNNCADNHVFVIGATNNPKGIDSAALRSGRLDIKVYVPAPDVSERIALFKLYLKDIVTGDVNYELLAEKTEGYVSRDVCSLINNAARETAQSNLDLINMQTLLNCIEKYKKQFPSVSKDVLKQHEQLREEFEGHIDRKPIGFTQY
jgi:transitional endoplasmic reticulum ATPase